MNVEEWGTTKQQTLGRRRRRQEATPLSCAILPDPPSEQLSLEYSRETVKPDKPRGTTTQEFRLVLLLVLLIVIVILFCCYCVLMLPFFLLSSPFVNVLLSMFCCIRKCQGEVEMLVTQARSSQSMKTTVVCTKIDKFSI